MGVTFGGKPTADSLSSVCGSVLEFDAASHFRDVQPCDFTAQLDPFCGILRNTNLHGPAGAHCSYYLQSKTILRSVQDNSAVVLVELDVRELARRFSWCATAFGTHQTSIALRPPGTFDRAAHDSTT
jgi:hypothetical protein